MLIHKAIHNPVIGVNVNISACLWSDQFHAYLATSRRLAVLPAIHRKDFMLLAEQQILEEKNRTEILELFPKTEWYLEWYNYGAHTNPASYVSTRIRYWGRNWSKYTDLSENYWAIPKRFYSVCHTQNFHFIHWSSYLLHTHWYHGGLSSAHIGWKARTLIHIYGQSSMESPAAGNFQSTIWDLYTNVAMMMFFLVLLYIQSVIQQSQGESVFYSSTPSINK